MLGMKPAYHMQCGCMQWVHQHAAPNHKEQTKPDTSMPDVHNTHTLCSLALPVFHQRVCTALTTSHGPAIEQHLPWSLSQLSQGSREPTSFNEETDTFLFLSQTRVVFSILNNSLDVLKYKGLVFEFVCFKRNYMFCFPTLFICSPSIRNMETFGNCGKVSHDTKINEKTNKRKKHLVKVKIWFHHDYFLFDSQLSNCAHVWSFFMFKSLLTNRYKFLYLLKNTYFITGLSHFEHSIYQALCWFEKFPLNCFKINCVKIQHTLPCESFAYNTHNIYLALAKICDACAFLWKMNTLTSTSVSQQNFFHKNLPLDHDSYQISYSSICVDCWLVDN